MAGLHRDLSNGNRTVTEVVDHFLQVIDEKNPDINALVHIDPDRARALAAKQDAGGPPVSVLAGLPTADKDLVQRAGMPTRYGTAVTSQDNSEISDPMALWVDDVGAISVGKTSTSEFGLSASTEARASGPTHNPHNVSRIAGGSSGGAAAAVAAGMLPFAPGSDGGGSVRIPAWACGVTGWKPSRGLIPAGSGFEYLAGLVVPGLLTQSAADMQLIASLLTRGEWHWSTRAGADWSRLESSASRPLRIGRTTATPWPTDWGVAPADDALSAWEHTTSALRGAGHEVIDLPWSPDQSYADHFFSVWIANASQIPVPDDKVADLEPLTQFLIERGRALPASELARALGALKVFERQTIAAFSSVDLVLTPGLAMEPPEIGWFHESDPEENFRQQVAFTPWSSFVNVAGLPALALPVSTTDSGLPMGVQLIGAPGGDPEMIRLGAELEAVLD